MLNYLFFHSFTKLALDLPLWKQVRSTWNFNTMCTDEWSQFAVDYFSII